MQDAISQEQAQQVHEDTLDEALMKGAAMSDINNIRARTGQPQAEVVAQTPGFRETPESEPVGAGFAPKTIGFAPSKEEPAISYQWKAEAAWEHVQKLQAATGISEQEKSSIYNDLVMQGSSARASELWSGLDREDKLAKLEGTASAVPDIGVDAAAQNVQDILEVSNEYVVDDAAIASVVAASSDPETMMDRWQDEIDSRDQFKREYAEVLQNKSITFSDLGQGAEALLAPFVTQSDLVQLGDMLEKQFGAPVDSDASAFVLQGSYLNTIRDWITELPAEEQLNVLRAVVETSNDTAGFFTDNDFLKKDMIRQLFAGATNEFKEGDIEVDKYINNAISLLDLSIIGTVAKGAVKAIAGSSRSSSLSTVKRVDPKQGESLTAASIADETGNTASALGTTKEDVVVESLLTKWKGYADDPLVDEKFVERQVDLLNGVQSRTTEVGVHMTEAEKTGQRDALVASLEKVAPLRAKLNKSTSYTTDTGIEVVAEYTTENFPAAKAAIERLHPEAKIEQVGEGVLKATIKDDYKIGEHVVFQMEDIYGRGNKAKYLGDISANLGKDLSNSFYVAHDTAQGYQHLFLEMIEPFTKAKNRNKGYILDILDRSRHSDVDLTVSEMRDMLPSGISAKDAQEVMQGVVSVRTMTDAAYVVENKIFRDRQIALNRRHVSNGDFNAIATPSSIESARNMKVAYDADSDTIVNLSPEMVNKIYEDGGQLAVSGATHGADDFVQTRNILITGNTSLKELPQQVLNHDANYLTTLYKDQYFVTQKKKKLTLDGDVVPDEALPIKVLSTAKSRKEAEAALVQLRKDNPDVEYDFKNSRELTAGQTAEAYESLRRSTGGLFFSKKGERLKDTVGNLAEIEDPVASIRTQAAGVGRLAAMRPITDLMKQRFINTFPELSRNGFPTSKASLVSPTKVMDDKVEAAKVMWDYINMTENGSVMQQQWQNKMVGFGEWLEDVTGSAKLGSFARTTLGQKDPLSTIRGTTFLATIVLNPARQLLIQSQQYLYLAGLEPAFVATGKAQRQGGALLMTTIGDKNISSKAAAKAAGMSVKEFEEFRTAFKESGLTEAIDSHLLGRDALLEVERSMTSSAIGAIGQGAANAAKSVIGVTKELGFNLGERINISNTYAIAWKRYKDKNGAADMTSKAAKTAIAADARQLALGMTRPGAFGYQDGWLSAATQFFSIQHKAFLTNMRAFPGLSKYGNKAITPKEARKIVAFQVGLYGGAGLGINSAIDAAMEEAGITDLTTQERQILHGGAFDLAMNKIISEVAGEEVDLSFAANMSAGQGFQESLLDYMGSIVSADISVLEMMAGASATVGSKFGTATKALKAALGAPSELTPEVAKAVVTDFASIASGYRQLLNAKAMSNLKQWVDKNRNILPIEVNDTEALVYGIVGIPTREVDSFYHHLETTKASKERLKSIAEDAFGRLSRRVADAAKESDKDTLAVKAMIEFLNKDAHVLKAVLGDDSADYYNVYSQVQDLIQQRIGNGEDDFMSNLYKALNNNTYGNDLPSILNNLGRNSERDPKELETMKSVFEKAINVGDE